MAPVLWGTEPRLRQLFAGSHAELSFERRMAPFEDDSAESYLSDYEHKLGPAILAKQALEPSGQWEATRAEVLALYEDANEAGEDGFLINAEYLETIVKLPA